MFSNFRYPLILFILSLIGMMIGMMIKVLHWPGGQLVTGSMVMVQLFSIVWLVVIVFRAPGR